MRCTRRGNNCGTCLIVFGLGLILARCMPIQLLLAVVAIVLILSGLSLCKSHF